MRWPLFVWLLSLGCAYADPPKVVSDSPDQAWEVEAKWVSNGADHEGYVWTLKNLKSGKIYFDEKPDADEILPHRFNVLWSPGSHYVALDLYYGRVVYGVNIIAVGREPESINPLPNSIESLVKLLIKPEDLPKWDGTGDPLVGANEWLNDTDLVLDVEMKTSLRGNVPATLDAVWHETVRFTGKSPKVIDSVCDTYDKEQKDK